MGGKAAKLDPAGMSVVWSPQLAAAVQTVWSGRIGRGRYSFWICVQPSPDTMIWNITESLVRRFGLWFHLFVFSSARYLIMRKYLLVFGHDEAGPNKHCLDKWAAHIFVIANMFTGALLNIQQTWGNISIHLEFCCGYSNRLNPNRLNPNFKSSFSSALVSTNSYKNTWLRSCQMFHFLYKVVSNFVCLLFGDVHVVWVQWVYWSKRENSCLLQLEMCLEESTESQPKLWTEFCTKNAPYS